MDEAEPAPEQRRGKRDSGQQAGYELARCADLTFDPERSGSAARLANTVVRIKSSTVAHFGYS
jgi:hypothetical protein